MRLAVLLVWCTPVWINWSGRDAADLWRSDGSEQFPRCLVRAGDPAGYFDRQRVPGSPNLAHTDGAGLNRPASTARPRRLRVRRHRSETHENRGSCGDTDKPRVGPWAHSVVPQETGFSRVAADAPSAAQPPDHPGQRGKRLAVRDACVGPPVLPQTVVRTEHQSGLDHSPEDRGQCSMLDGGAVGRCAGGRSGL